MILIENRDLKQYVLLNDLMQQVCTFTGANLVRCVDKSVYQLQTDVTLYVLCELPIASTTLIRSDSILSGNVVFYSEPVEEEPEDAEPDDGEDEITGSTDNDSNISFSGTHSEMGEEDYHDQLVQGSDSAHEFSVG